MLIQIDENKRIRSNNESWNIEIRSKPNKETPGETTFRAIKYFTSFAKALRYACQQEMRNHPAIGLTDCIAAAEEINAKYQAIFDATDVAAEIGK